MVGRPSFVITALSLLEVLPLALAHSSDGHVGESMGRGSIRESSNLVSSAMNTSSTALQSYFSYPEYSTLIIAHIFIMTVAWFIVLPIGVMLSLARSGLALSTQLAFLCVNALGLLLGIVYNDKTPDLYENNIHHKLGWALTWIVLAQTAMGFIKFCADARKADQGEVDEQAAYIPISTEAMSEHQRILGISIPDQYRFSHDSGQGTEPDSSGNNSLSSMEENADKDFHRTDHQSGYEDRIDIRERGVTGNSAFNKFLQRVPLATLKRVMRVVNFLLSMIDRSILLLGFVAITSGIVVYGGIFKGSNIFNGLAHFIKGGIFFWYGLLTLGRWMGCFAEYGWAWNVKPPVGVVSPRKAAVPSAEFVESFVIFFYGSTNVFLEHLAAWGGAWTAQDLEHVSISIMFLGGGLCGMLVESRRVRDFLNTTILISPANRGFHSDKEPWDPPRTYGFSMNPIPGLIILLLGLMMSSHHQASMVSTMVHKQWGTLLVGFSLARAVTYILIYLSPPSSFLPSRPPSEIIASFCLISGGLVFMASNKNTVSAIESYDLNAMFIFTVTMGITALLMAWSIVVFAVKGWAVRRSQASYSRPRSSSA